MDHEAKTKRTGSESEARAALEKKALVKNQLAQYVGIKIETNNLLEQLEKLKREDARKGTSRADEYMQRITPRIQENKQFMDRLERAVQKIPDPLERCILEMRHLDSNTCRLTGWNAVTMRLYHKDDARTTSAVFRLHDRALRSLSAILESGCEQ